MNTCMRLCTYITIHLFIGEREMFRTKGVLKNDMRFMLNMILHMTDLLLAQTITRKLSYTTCDFFVFRCNCPVTFYITSFIDTNYSTGRFNVWTPSATGFRRLAVPVEEQRTTSKWLHERDFMSIFVNFHAQNSTMASRTQLRLSREKSNILLTQDFLKIRLVLLFWCSAS
jgi:hypothetical protein